mgnify:CR=1 FL=1
MQKKELALQVIERLKKEYPDTGCSLDYDDAWKLLVSVRLAAQCTDARVNVVVQDLYREFPDVDALADADVEEIERIVKPCGLGHSKARDISACMKMLKEKFGIEARTIRDLGWDKVFSIMGRHVARAEEALLIANAVEGWLKEVKPDGETFTPFEIPQSAEGYGCSEAPRGSLVHYIRVKDQKIDSYQIISATLWNCSPRDDKGRRGPLEEALIGVQVPDINNPVNVGRTIRAFDP